MKDKNAIWYLKPTYDNISVTAIANLKTAVSPQDEHQAVKLI